MNNPKLSAAILIVSDTASSDPSTDKCGSVLQKVLENAERVAWDIVIIKIVPDDVDEIQKSIKEFSNGKDAPNLILTSGGTGFSVKDNTPEALSPLIHKLAPGLVHGMLASSLAVTPFAMMSRPVAGIRNKTVIITLPGSPKGAKENLEAVLKQLPHACLQAAGADSRALHAGGIKQLESDAGISGVSDPPSEGSHRHVHHHPGHTHKHQPGDHHVPTPHTTQKMHPQSNDPEAGPSMRHRSSPYPMLSMIEALDLIQRYTPPPRIDKAQVNTELVGTVLAEDIVAEVAVPAFRASIVDGYAVRIPPSGKLEKGVYPVSLVSHARASDIASLEDRTVARITTGAPLPPGANAVIMVEDTLLKTKTDDDKEEEEIEILTDEIKLGENVREIGSDVQKGDVILEKGTRVTATGGELGLLASTGCMSVLIYKKPVIGVLSTGDEIVAHNKEGALHLGEVRDTNRLTLLTAIRGFGFDALDLGIVSDKHQALEDTLRSSFRRADIIVTSGGVSMGELDLLKPTIERALGGKIHFGRVNVKPGKPSTFASIPLKDTATGERSDKLIFALPGNPASAVVTFHLFVLPSLHQASGVLPAGLPRVRVLLEEGVQCDSSRPEYQRAMIIAKNDGFLYASTTGGQRSSRIGSFKSSNGLLCLPAGGGYISKGQKVDALLLGRLVSNLL